METDIIELRTGSGRSGRNGNRQTISINLIHAGVTTQLFFGPNADLTEISLNENYLACAPDSESTLDIKLQNGSIIQSACTGKFINNLQGLINDRQRLIIYRLASEVLIYAIRIHYMFPLRIIDARS